MESVQMKYLTKGLEVTITKLTSDRSRLVVIGAYRPPSSRRVWFDTFQELIIELLPHGKLILMGDLNCDLLKPDSSLTKNLNAALELGNLTCPDNSHSPTRVTSNSATCIDIIAVDRDLMIGRYEVSDFLISDHMPVEADLNLNKIATISPVMKRSFRNVDFSELGDKMADFQLEEPLDSLHLDEQLQKWNTHFVSVLDDVAPVRPFPRINQKWTGVDKDTSGLMRLRRSKARQLRTGNHSPEDHELVKHLKRVIKSRIRASIKSQGSLILARAEPRETWKFIRKATFTQSKGKNYLPDIDLMNDHFADIVSVISSFSAVEVPSAVSSLSAVDVPATSSIPGSGDLSGDKFDILSLDIAQTTRLLQRVRSNSATGPDDIPPFLIRILAEYIAPNITLLYNSSIQNGLFPGDWKKANVVAVYKNKGSKSLVDNYRPISILPILGRVLEKFVSSQLQLFCDSNGIIPIQQFGFRKHSSCELTLLAAMDTWMKDVSSGNLAGALLIDLSKAFDSISHVQLIQELRSIGCSHSALKWFSSYLTGRVQRVKMGSELASWKPVLRGVPQGSPLSPLLFNIMVRHLPQASPGLAFQFADDLTNSVSASNTEDLESKLVDVYSKVKTFCSDRQLQINLAKTQLIIFKPIKRKLPENFGIKLDNVWINPSNTVNLLGITLDHHFTMAAHIDAVVQKCRGLLGVLRRCTGYLPQDLLKLVYIALIRAQLEYCSATFINSAPTHLRKLDTIQKIASRIITNSTPQTHSAPLLLQLGLDSLESRRRSHVLSLVEDILTGKSHPYFKDYFNSDHATVSLGVTGNKLDNKRFAHFGIAIHKEQINSKEATSPSCPFNLLSWGHSLSADESKKSSTAFSSRSDIQLAGSPKTPGARLN